MTRIRKLPAAVILALTLVFASAIAVPVSAAPGEEGLIMALEFDEGTPAKVEKLTLKDTSGGGHNATLQNPKAKDDTEFPTIRFEDGKFGKSLRLNGAQQYLDVDKAVFNQDALTIAFWVNYRGGANWQRFFEMGTAETGEHFMIVPSTDAGKFQISGYNKKEEFSFISNPTDGSFRFPVNQWVHVALTMDKDGNTSIYYNGAPMSVTTIIDKKGTKQTVKNKTSFKSPVSVKYVATITGLENPDWFAARFGCPATTAWDSKLLGSFDAIKVYNRALSADQVKLLFEKNTTVAAGEPASSAATGNPASSKPSGGTVSNAPVQSGASSTIVSSGAQAVESAVSAASSEEAVSSTSGGALQSDISSKPEGEESGFPVWGIVLIIVGIAAAGGTVFILMRKKAAR